MSKTASWALDPPSYVTHPPVECVVFAWGANEDGQLGIDAYDEVVYTPHVVEVLLGSRLRGREFARTPLVGGSRMTLAISGDGQVLTWGWNKRGSLGRGNKDSLLLPAQLEALKRVKVVQGAAGGWHAMVVTETGDVFAWGGNEYGQCGVDEVQRDIVSPVRCVQNLRVQQVACGGMHSLALTTDGDVYSWGERWGEFSLKLDRRPRRVEGASDIMLIACGAFHNLALNKYGKVITWGTNDYGQLGIGNTTYRTSPEEVVDLHGIFISNISAGGWHSMAVSKEGEVYVWGRGEHGRLGLGDSSSRLRPQKVPGLEDHNVVQVSAGGTHSAALTDTGRVLIWGRGSFGRMGDGMHTTRQVPYEVPLPGGARRWHVIAVACGGRHTLCLAFPLPSDSGESIQLSGEEGNSEGEGKPSVETGSLPLMDDYVGASTSKGSGLETGLHVADEENRQLPEVQKVGCSKNLIVDMADDEFRFPALGSSDEVQHNAGGDESPEQNGGTKEASVGREM